MLRDIKPFLSKKTFVKRLQLLTLIFIVTTCLLRFLPAQLLHTATLDFLDQLNRLGIISTPTMLSILAEKHSSVYYFCATYYVDGKMYSFSELKSSCKDKVLKNNHTNQIARLHSNLLELRLNQGNMQNITWRDIYQRKLWKSFHPIVFWRNSRKITLPATAYTFSFYKNLVGDLCNKHRSSKVIMIEHFYKYFNYLENKTFSKTEVHFAYNCKTHHLLKGEWKY